MSFELAVNAARLTDPLAPTLIEVAGLSQGPQVRLGGVNPEHVRALSRTPEAWPPIVVNRDDLTVVDGWYRTLAARHLGRSHIRCVFHDGSPDKAYLRAVQANLSHGLSLSLREREHAARRILRRQPNWSDRLVAEVCGLAPGTVGRIRTSTGCSTGQDQQWTTRTGRDGRRRPVDPQESRERIAEALRERPGESLREIARMTGTSPATVGVVRSLLDRGAAVRSCGPESTVPALRSVDRVVDRAVATAPGGPEFSSWFEHTDIGSEWRSHVDAIPASRVYVVGDEARRRAREWNEFATALEERGRGSRRAP